MRLPNYLFLFLTMSLTVVLLSCGGNHSEANVMTTQEFIEVANELGKEEFKKKYQEGSEIELVGEVRTVSIWDDKANAKFGTGLNDLPLRADFMFEDNGGNVDATRKSVKTGEKVHFKGIISYCFFDESDQLETCDITDCVAL